MPEGLEVLLLDDEPIVGKRLKPALAKIVRLGLGKHDLQKTSVLSSKFTARKLP